MSDDNRLRDLFASHIDGVSQTPSCPSPDELWAAVRGELPHDRLAAVLDHLTGCASCTEDWKMAADLAEGLPPVRARVRPFWWAAGAAAAIIASILLAPRWRNARPQSQPTTVYRAPINESIQPLTADGASLPRGEFTLRWSPVDGARYAIEVSTEDLAIVDSAAGLAGHEYVVPAGKLRDVPSGTKIAWQVQATLPDGRQVRSPAFFAIVQ